MSLSEVGDDVGGRKTAQPFTKAQTFNSRDRKEL